jgi:hypothetical protein
MIQPMKNVSTAFLANQTHPSGYIIAADTSQPIRPRSDHSPVYIFAVLSSSTRRRRGIDIINQNDRSYVILKGIRRRMGTPLNKASWEILVMTASELIFPCQPSSDDSANEKRFTILPSQSDPLIGLFLFSLTVPSQSDQDQTHSSGYISAADPLSSPS